MAKRKASKSARGVKGSRGSRSVFQTLGQQIQLQADKDHRSRKINLNTTIRDLREKQKLSGISLCRKSGALDPKTLTALEKGRIKNPSMETLQAVARGLGVPISEIFRQAESGLERYFYQGTQKGYYQMEFPWLGVKLISYTPFVHEFFCGKMIIAARKKMDETIFRHDKPIFISVLVGRIELDIEERKTTLREGQNVFFNGSLRHTLFNPMHRETVLSIMTAPSFV